MAPPSDGDDPEPGDDPGGAGPDASGAPATEDPRVVRTRNDVLGAALTVLADEGSGAVTHPRLARAAGYSRATVYKHWPTRTDLFRDALARLRDVEHHTPTGDLRADLIGELAAFRTAMQQHGLDRALAVLTDLSRADQELTRVHEDVVGNGERVIRELLSPLPDATRRDAVLLMLCGSVLYAALLHGRPPDDAVLAAAVDVALAGLDPDDAAALGR